MTLNVPDYSPVISLDSTIVENLLTNQTVGTFILSQASSSSTLTLSFVNQDCKIEHRHLKQADRHKILTSDGKEFDNIQSYVQLSDLRQRKNIVKDLIKLAKEAASQDPNLSKNIKDYGLDPRDKEQREALIEIAKLAAQQGGWVTSEYIQNYGLDPRDKEQREALIEIAKLAAQQGGWVTSEYIQNYGLDPRDKEQREALIEIAKLAAQQDGEGISCEIKNCGLDPRDKEQREALIEIAKLAALQNGKGVSYYIQNYGLDPSDKEQREALAEIAKLAAQQSGYGISQYIHKYGLDPRDKEQRQVLIDIAKLIAQQDGWRLSMTIIDYGLNPGNKEHRQALIEIAKLAAKQDGEGTSKYIKNYGFDPRDKEQREALIEIAKLAVQQDGEGTSKYIQKYGFDPRDKEQREALIEIAKLAAQQDGYGASYYIQNYGLDPRDKEQREALIEIAKLAARQNGEGTTQCLGHYQLTLLAKEENEKTVQKGRFDFSPEEEILKIAAHSYLSPGISAIPVLLEPSLDLIFHFRFQKSLDLMTDVDADKEAALKELEDFYTKQLGDRSPFNAFKDYLGKVGKIKEGERHTVQAICWFAITSNTLTFVDSKWEKEELETLFKQLAGIQDPLLRSDASFLLAADILPSAEKRDLYLSLNKGSAMALPALCLAALGGGNDTLSSIANSLAKVKSSSKKQRAVKDSFFANLWMKALLALIQDQSFSASFKAGLLEAIVKQGKSKEELQSLLFTLKGLFEFQAQDKVKGFEKASSLSEFLKQKYAEAFQEVIPLSDVKEDEIQALFQKFRDPQALLKYASALKKLPDSSLMLKELADCLEKLLDKSFPACRYEGSEHLTAIFGSDSSLKDAWTKKRSASLAIQISDEKQIFDSGKFILQALDQGHADASHYFLLVKYLRGNPEDKDAVKQSLKGEQGDPSLDVQLALIHLIEDPANKAFEDVFSKLPKKGEEAYALQFDADIRGLKKQWKQLLKQEKDEELTIVNTDDAVDLFLCGTEVEGSCQNIDGEPDYNKCLLGYVMDGKNRLLAIKDPDGKIKARSIVRLLWDEKEKKSVLFLERVYPPSAKKEWTQALEQEAFALAKELNIPLVSKEVGKGDSYPNPLWSLSGKAPYEYVDASNGVTDGEFAINQAHLITDL